MAIGDGVELFENYFESTFKHINFLTTSAYDRACVDFDAYYGHLLPDERDAPILDIGCGTGPLLYYLEKKGYRNVQGIDISQQQVDYCRRHLRANVKQASASEFLSGKNGCASNDFCP